MADKPKTRAERLAELEAQRKAIESEPDDDDDGIDYWIERGDNRASVPAKSKVGRQIAGFFKESFGIDLSAEPVQDDDKGDDGKGDGKGKADGKSAAGSGVVRFGRRSETG